MVFADDLNAFRMYDAKAKTEAILADMDACQLELHKWGQANQVTFDARKESQHILSRQRPYGEPFELLGVLFDCKLLMTDTVLDLVRDCRWKLKAILRTGRFNTGLQLVAVYKAQLLSFIEYRTAAIYHACGSSLERLDHIQEKLSEAAGITAIEALNVGHLAPLAARRDMALLGLIHRTVLGRGPAHFAEIFVADRPAREAALMSGKHRLQLREYSGGHWTDFAYPNSRPADYIEHSMLGLISVYNSLPAQIVESSGSVSSFQAALQQLLAARANDSTADDWATTFSPRRS